MSVHLSRVLFEQGVFSSPVIFQSKVMMEFIGSADTRTTSMSNVLPVNWAWDGLGVYENCRAWSSIPRITETRGANTSKDAQDKSQYRKTLRWCSMSPCFEAINGSDRTPVVSRCFSDEEYLFSSISAIWEPPYGTSMVWAVGGSSWGTQRSVF